MKKLVVGFIFAFSLFSSLMAATYPLDLRKDIDLSGIKKIRFELGTLNGVMMLSTVRAEYVFSGGSSERLSISLDGAISSNRKNLLPRLLADKKGDTLTVRLYDSGAFSFFLVQSGNSRFTALVPVGFAGSVEIAVSSGHTGISCLSSDSLDVKSSSGSIDGDSILCKKTFGIRASSGSVKLDKVVSSDASISVTSGDTAIGELACSASLVLHSSSGGISARSLASDSFSVTSSSGSVSLDKLVAGNSTVNVSSGSVTIGNLTGGLVCDVSSGNVTLALPVGSAFSASLRTSSGKIESDFRLMGDAVQKDGKTITGDANGGGVKIQIRVSSGDINIREK